MKKKLLIVMQDEPFFLPDLLESFLPKLKAQYDVLGCLLLRAGVDGKAKSTLQTAVATYKVFGLKFFISYSFLYLKNKIFLKKTCKKTFGNLDIPVFDVMDDINNKHNLEFIESLKPDYLISILSNQIFKRKLLRLAPCLNLHTGPLPYYRGLMPTFWTMLADEKEAGVSIFLVDEGIDTGPVIVQRFVSIGDRSHQQMVIETKKVGLDAMLIALNKISSPGWKATEQPNVEGSYFGFPKKSDVRLFLSKGKRLV